MAAGGQAGSRLQVPPRPPQLIAHPARFAGSTPARGIHQREKKMYYNAEAENESGDQVTAAAAAVKGAQADHDAASTPNARAITLLRLRETRNWMAQVQQELERTEAMADAPPLVRYLPYSPPALPWTGTALILEDDALVTRALIVGNPPDAK